MIILEMNSIYKAAQSDLSKLSVIPAHYNWEDEIWEEDEPILPQLGNPLYFDSWQSPHVVEINGINYSVKFEEDDYDDPCSHEGKRLILEKVNVPKSIGLKSDRRPYLSFFGQPRWVQGAYYPADLNGEPLRHFLTIENGWGDSGNYNILIGLKDGIPNIAYFEASCC